MTCKDQGKWPQKGTNHIVVHELFLSIVTIPATIGAKFWI
jgi:hypothetical protein